MIRIGKDTIKHINYGDKEELITPSEIPKFLGDEIQLEKGVSFKRIFDLIIINRKIFDIVFASQKGFYPIDIYLDEYVKKDDDNDPDSITYLEAYYSTDYFKYGDEKEELEWYPSFHGINERYTDEYQIEPCEMPIGLMFTPINHWKKYEVRIDNEVSFSHFDTSVKPPKNIIFVEGIKTMKTFDFFVGILRELTWSGTPKDRDEKVADLNAISDRIDRGEEKLFEWIKDENGNHFLKDEDGNLKPFFEYDEDGNLKPFLDDDED